MFLGPPNYPVTAERRRASLHGRIGHVSTFPSEAGLTRPRRGVRARRCISSGLLLLEAGFPVAWSYVGSYAYSNNAKSVMSAPEVLSCPIMKPTPLLLERCLS